ncbi:MAG: PPC domain-containing DNA-binding protein [Patescibacteria group bacterium]
MQHFALEGTARSFALRLDPGDMVLECLEEMIQKEGVRDAVVVSGIGTLDRCTLHMVTTTGYPPVEHFAVWEDKPLELAALQGIIAGGRPHLHAVVSDTERAYAGHLEPGCRVLYLAEIVLFELHPAGLTRMRDERGIMRLVHDAG